MPRIIVLHDPLSAEEHDTLGAIYESQGKFDLAAEQYRGALKKDGKRAWSWIRLAELSYRTKEYSEAESAFRKALQLEPENGDLINNLAWVYVETGANLDLAEQLIMRALRMNPGNRAYYLDTFGVILLKKGNIARAVAVLKEAIDLIPDNRRDLKAQAEQHLLEACKAAGEKNPVPGDE